MIGVSAGKAVLVHLTPHSPKWCSAAAASEKCELPEVLFSYISEEEVIDVAVFSWRRNGRRSWVRLLSCLQTQLYWQNNNSFQSKSLKLEDKS